MPEVLSPNAPDTTDSPADIDDDILYEVIDGRIVEKPSMGAFECWVAMRLQQFLLFSSDVRGKGIVIPEVLFLIDPARNLKRRPDLAFVSYERWPADRPVPKQEAWPVVPDLSIEIVSQSNKASEVVSKLCDYFGAGVRQAWVVYPIEQVIYVYRSATEVVILKPGQDLDGGDVLPGFRLPVADLLKIKVENAPPPADG